MTSRKAFVRTEILHFQKNIPLIPFYEKRKYQYEIRKGTFLPIVRMLART